MRTLFLIIINLCFVNANFCQRVGAGIYFGKESNWNGFDELYQFQLSSSSVTFNQSKFDYNNYGAYVFFSNDKRIKNQVNLGVTFTYDSDLSLSSNDQLLNPLTFDKYPYFNPLGWHFRLAQLSNKFSYKIIEYYKFRLDATARLGYQLFLKDKMIEDFNNIGIYKDGSAPPSYYETFEFLLMKDFLFNQILTMNNYLTFDFGLDLSIDRLTGSISGGINLTKLGESNVFGRMRRIDVSVAYALFSKPVDFKKRKLTNYKNSGSHMTNSSANHVFLRIVQPIYNSISFSEEGIYATNYNTKDDAKFGNEDFERVGYTDYKYIGYQIYKIDKQPEIKLLPGLAFGLQIETKSNFFSTIELGYSFMNIKFADSYYNKEYSLQSGSAEISDDNLTVQNALTDFTVKVWHPYLSGTVNYRIPLLKNFNLQVGTGFTAGFTGQLPQYHNSSGSYYTPGYTYPGKRPVLYPRALNATVGASVGIERNSFVVELNYNMTLLDYFAATIPIGLGKLQTISVSINAPLFKLKHQ